MMDIYEATCLGCKHLEQDYESDWSEMTPGRGYYCYCTKGHFGGLGAYETHMLIHYRQGCIDFQLDGDVVKELEELKK